MVGSAKEVIEKRRSARLSAKAVEAAKPGMHGDGGGLWLHVSGRGTRSWIFRFTSPLDGKPHEMGLGPLHTVTLAQARIKALDCRRQVLEGGDPLAARQARRDAARVSAAKVVTFKECAEAYITEFQASWRNPEAPCTVELDANELCLPDHRGSTGAGD